MAKWVVDQWLWRGASRIELSAASAPGLQCRGRYLPLPVSHSCLYTHSLPPARHTLPSLLLSRTPSLWTISFQEKLVVVIVNKVVRCRLWQKPFAHQQSEAFFDVRCNGVQFGHLLCHMLTAHHLWPTYFRTDENWPCDQGYPTVIISKWWYPSRQTSHTQIDLIQLCDIKGPTI